MDSYITIKNIHRNDDISLDLQELPPDLQKKIMKIAKISTLVDQAKNSLQVDNIDLPRTIARWLQQYDSHATKTLYRHVWHAFAAYCTEHHLSPLGITAEQVDEYIYFLRQKKSANSIRCYIAALSSLFSELVRYGKRPVNPFRRVRLPKREFKKSIRSKGTASIPVMDRHEYQSIIDAFSTALDAGRWGNHLREMAYYAAQVMAMYGLRIGAVPTITYHGNYISYTSKGTQYMKPVQWFPTRSKRPFMRMSIQSFRNYMHTTTHRLSQQRILRHPYSAHDFRHFFARQHYQKHKDIILLKEALGHSSLAVTDRYVQQLGL